MLDQVAFSCLTLPLCYAMLLTCVHVETLTLCYAVFALRDLKLLDPAQPFFAHLYGDNHKHEYKCDIGVAQCNLYSTTFTHRISTNTPQHA